MRHKRKVRLLLSARDYLQKHGYNAFPIKRQTIPCNFGQSRIRFLILIWRDKIMDKMRHK